MVSDFFMSARSLGAVQGISCAPWAKKITPRSSLKGAVAMLSSVETMFRIMCSLRDVHCLATDDLQAIHLYNDSLHRGILCKKACRGVGRGLREIRRLRVPPGNRTALFLKK